MFHYFMFFPAKKKESNKTCLLPYLFGAVSQLSERLSLGLLFSTRPLNKIETPSHTVHVFYLTQPISILKFTDSYSKAGTCAYYEDSFYLNLSLSIAWFLYLPSSRFSHSPQHSFQMVAVLNTLFLFTLPFYLLAPPYLQRGRSA